MVTPADFFSTIAQATGVLVGLVIAFSTSVFTMKRSNRRNKIKSLQSDIQRKHESYSQPLKDMIEEIEAKGKFTPNMYVVQGESDNVIDNIQGWAENEDTTSGELWAYLFVVRNSLSEAAAADKGTTIHTKLDTFERALIEAGRILDWRHADSHNLFRDIMGIPDDIDGYDRMKIFDGTSVTVKQQIESEGTGNPDEFQTIAGWHSVVDDLSEEVQDIKNRHGTEWLINYDNASSRNVLISSLVVFTVGTLIPTAFLIGIPPSAWLAKYVDWSAGDLAAIQICSLTILTVSSFILFFYLIRMIKKEV